MNDKIVKIIDEYTVIINAGTNKGIEVGDRFQIIDTKGSEVRDPDTDAVLGHLNLIKDTVTVSEVHEKMCFCTSPYLISASNLMVSSIQNLAEGLSMKERKRLNVDLSQVTGGLRKSEKPIRVGDLVRLIKSSTTKIEH